MFVNSQKFKPFSNLSSFPLLSLIRRRG